MVHAASHGAVEMQQVGNEHRELLRVATAGSVDDGKSTLVGRMFSDTGNILDDQLDLLARSSRARGQADSDLALLTDGLRAEQEQGITIDVAYRSLESVHRRIMLADSPGHVQYTRNAVTAMSNADVALILVDVTGGLVPQARRHLVLASLLHVPHIVLCLNKMDLVGWSESAFEDFREDFEEFASRLDLADVTLIPISALYGDNVVHRSEHMDWYEGYALLSLLDSIHVASDRNLIDLRFVVQRGIWVPGKRPNGYRGYAGYVVSGVMYPGEELVSLPSGYRATVAGIDMGGASIDSAFWPLAITVRLADDLDMDRGNVLSRPNNQPIVGQDLAVMTYWMGERPLTSGQQLLVQHPSQLTKVRVEDLNYRLDIETLHRDHEAGVLATNDIGRVRFRCAQPLCYDSYRRNRLLGGVLLVDEMTGDTVGAGTILDAGA